MVWLVEQADQVTDQKAKAAAKADAVRTGAAIALGTGGAAYLLLAYRRQRLDEVDTRERRITELYTKAVEQLGHEKAPSGSALCTPLSASPRTTPSIVRPSSTYSAPTCACPIASPRRTSRTQSRWRRRPRSTEELQVRQTTQHILAAHLKLPSGIVSAAARRRQPSPRRAFWPGISLDLTGAALVDFNFSSVSAVQAQFNGVTFRGDTLFDGATFQDHVGFHKATFQDDARFARATFQSSVLFSQATFKGAYTGFIAATFQDIAGFSGARFQDIAGFSGARFQGYTVFDEATFRSYAGFMGATFEDIAGFRGTTFQAKPHSTTRTSRATSSSMRRECCVWTTRYSTRSGCGRTGGLSAPTRLDPPTARLSLPSSRQRNPRRRSPRRTRPDD